VIEVSLPHAEVRFTGHDEGDVRADGPRAALAAAVGRELVFGHQVHGTRVVVEPDAIEEADGIVVRGERAPLVFTADCLPVAVAGPGGVAMLHAGWRGLAGGVLEAGIARLDGGATHAVIGPAAGGCCYAVGEEVADALGLTRSPSGTVDLRAEAARRLRAAGVAEVADVGVCTLCDERFFSHRREGAGTGRNGGVAWRRSSSPA